MDTYPILIDAFQSEDPARPIVGYCYDAVHETVLVQRAVSAQSERLRFRKLPGLRGARYPPDLEVWLTSRWSYIDFDSASLRIWRTKCGVW